MLLFRTDWKADSIDMKCSGANFRATPDENLLKIVKDLRPRRQLTIKQDSIAIATKEYSRLNKL